MLPLLARQARALERLLLQRAVGRVLPLPHGSCCSTQAGGSGSDEDIWADPFGDGSSTPAAAEGVEELRGGPAPKQAGSKGTGATPRRATAAARRAAAAAMSRAPVSAESAAATLGVDASSMAWLDAMATEVKENWRAAPETVVAVMEEARRHVAARRLPAKQLSEAVSKALQLSRAFPSLSAKDLLTEAVLHAQTGALAADVLLERASKLRRVLPDTPPAARLLRTLTAEEVSARILAAVRVFRSVLDTPMPVPLLDVPANLDRLLKVDAAVLRGRLQSLIGLLGPGGALAAVHARPVEAVLTPAPRLGPRVAGAQTILGCSDPLEAFSAAIALRTAPDYVEIFEAARDLGALTGAPPVQLVPLFVAYGAPAPHAVAGDTAARFAALRGLMPAAAPADLAVLLRLAAARRNSPETLAASIGMAAGILGLSPYRVLQLLLRDARAVGRAVLDAAGAVEDSAGDDAAVDEIQPGAPQQQQRDPRAPHTRRRAHYDHFLVPPEVLRARADEIGRLLGVSGVQLASLLRYQPRLLAASVQTLRLRVDGLTSFLTGVDGGGAGGDVRLKDTARSAAQSALRLCPKLLHLDVSTCVERVRTVEAALRLPASAAWRMALRAPQIMAQPKERLHAAAMRLHALAGDPGEARRVVQQSPSVLVHLCNLAPRAGSSDTLHDGANASDEDDSYDSSSNQAAAATESQAGLEASSGIYGSRLRWIASELCLTEGDALAAAVRSPVGRRLLGSCAEATARETAATLAQLTGRSVGELLRSALGDSVDGHSYSRLLSTPARVLEARAATIFSTLGLDAAPPERRAALLRSAPNLLALPQDTLEAKVLGLYEVLQELLPSLGGHSFAIGAGADSGVISGAQGVADDAAALEAVCRAVLARPLVLGLATDGLICRARRLKHVAEAFPPWAAQLAGPQGAAVAGRILVFADARHDRLYYLLATGLASTSGVNGGPISITAALGATDDAFARRFPGFKAFADVTAAARRGGGDDARRYEDSGSGVGDVSAAWGAAPVLRPHGGTRVASPGDPTGDAGAESEALNTATAVSLGSSRSRSGAGRAVVLRMLRAAAAASDTQSAGVGDAGLPTSAFVEVLQTEAGLAESSSRELLAAMKREGLISSDRADTGPKNRPLLWRLPSAGTAATLPAAANGSGGGSGARSATLVQLRAAGPNGLPTAALLDKLQSECSLTPHEAAVVLRRLRRQGVIIGRRPDGAVSGELVWRLPEFDVRGGAGALGVIEEDQQQATAHC